MTPVSLTAAFLGQRVTAPGGIGGECVDWVDIAINRLHGLPPVRANAIDWPRAILPPYLWTANAPLNFPPPGGLVVWGPT